jgi:hypothetical protein
MKIAVKTTKTTDETITIFNSIILFLIFLNIFSPSLTLQITRRL